MIFTIAVLCHVMFLVGYRTRLFNALSFVLIVSLDQRLVMIENGGYVILNLLVGYALFMPVGLRFSVDALLRSFREHKEKAGATSANRYRPEDQSRPAEGAHLPPRARQHRDLLLLQRRQQERRRLEGRKDGPLRPADRPHADALRRVAPRFAPAVPRSPDSSPGRPS
ncbi:MAG: hypothetical protein U0441_05805 [Polyangiaceae bacterium]